MLTLMVVLALVAVLANVAGFNAVRAGKAALLRAETAEHRANDFSHGVERERMRHQFWQERAGEWRKLYMDERVANEMAQSEHVKLLKAMAPGYIIERTNGPLAAEPEDDTPSVGAADRAEAVERREQAERNRLLREQGYEKVAVDDVEVEPPYRLDGTAADDEEGDDGA